MEPWQWPEDEWRQRVDQVRAGRSLKPKCWPGGAKCAVALSFDSDHETNELRDGGTSIGRMSWGHTATGSASRASWRHYRRPTCAPHSLCLPSRRCCIPTNNAG
jgi:hypothetical protein